jgi:hypothetical protein
MRTSAALLALAALALVLSSAVGASNQGTVTLTGTVGPGFTITLKNRTKVVKVLAPAKYAFTIQDKSAIHNFHLTGPGVNRTTSKLGKARLVWRVTLRRGLYTYRSDATPTLRGTLRVTA